MKDFKYWDNRHRNEKLEEFSNDRTGLLWLKTKSIIRKELIGNFLQQNNINLQQTSLKQQFIELFDLLKPTIISYLDNFKSKKIEDLKVEFEFKGKPHGFSALADVIFVVK